MDKRTDTPFYQRLSFNLTSVALIIAGLYIGKDIILPLLFSILLANLLLPLTNYFHRRKFHKTFSILIPLLLAIIVGVGLLYFLSSQIIKFIDDIPDLQKRFDAVSRSFQVWFREGTSITIRKQNQYLHDTVGDLKDKAPVLMKMTVTSLTGILTYVILMPLYTFLILYYRSNIKIFLILVFKNAYEQNVKEVLTESTTIAQKYLTGLLIETSLVFILNMIGFLLVGIKYAVFLALLAALLNLVPYVGMLVGNILCMMITLVSSDVISNVIWVGAILALVQFLDNNFGMPLIVGNKVRINALVTILGIVVGGALCGIPGMFLAIPGLAVLKVIFDKVPELKPWGLLLGDNQTNDLSSKKIAASTESL